LLKATNLKNAKTKVEKVKFFWDEAMEHSLGTKKIEYVGTLYNGNAH